MNAIAAVAGVIAAEGYTGTAERIIKAAENKDYTTILEIAEALDALGLPSHTTRKLMFATKELCNNDN